MENNEEIDKKEEKVVEAKKTPKKDLTGTGWCVIINAEGKYELVEIDVNITKNSAKIVNVKPFAQHHYQAIFEYEKLLARDMIIPEKRK